MVRRIWKWSKPVPGLIWNPASTLSLNHHCTVERLIGNTWYTIETVCDGNELLTDKVKRLIFSDKGVAC